MTKEITISLEEYKELLEYKGKYLGYIEAHTWTYPYGKTTITYNDKDGVVKSQPYTISCMPLSNSTYSNCDIKKCDCTYTIGGDLD